MPNYTNNSGASWTQTTLRYDDGDPTSTSSTDDGLGQLFERESESEDTTDETMIAETPQELDGADNLRVAPEIEWARSEEAQPTMTKRGLNSNPILRAVEDHHGRRKFDVGGWRTRLAVDSTIGDYGAEFVPDEPLTAHVAEEWFASTIEMAEDISGHGYEPTGLMEPGYSTAGLHLHLSPLSRRMADELWEMSQEPWMQAFTGSSIAEDPLAAKVFRGGQYCDTKNRDDHYAAVRPRGEYHYEWRLPEPMNPQHFGHLIRMLDIWIQDGRADAREFAIGQMRQDGSDVTAVQRAEAVGIQDELMESIEVSMNRTAHPQTVEFFDTVKHLDGAPYAFRAVMPDGDYYYFHSFEDPDLEATVEDFDITVEHGTVLDATTLDRVEDLGSRLEDALESTGADNPYKDSPDAEELRSAATDFLLDTAFEE